MTAHAPSSRSATPALVATLVAVLAAPRASAQDPVPSDIRPTRGVDVPGGVIAGDADATALELNPGQLGMLGAASLALVTDFWPDSAVRPGRGTGIFLAGPLWPFDSLSYGLGLQWLRPSGAEVSSASHLKLQVGAGLRLGSRLSLGFSWSHLSSSGNVVIDGADSFDIGATLRPHKRFALGLVVHDVNRPDLAPAIPGGTAPLLQRVWEPELVVRPLGDERIELAGGIRVGETRRDLAPRGRLAARVRRGLWVFAGLDTALRAFDATMPGQDQIDYRGTLGLRADFDHLGLGVAALAGSNGGFGPSAARRIASGAGLVLRLNGERHAPLADFGRIERLDLGGVRDDRAFVKLVVRLRRTTSDPAVRAVLLKIDGFDLGLGRIEEVRELVAALRQAGKRVIAYLPSISVRDYYLASACDSIVVHPAGELALGGLSQEFTFYKAALDRLGVNLDLVRIAEFKGAMEPFVFAGHSEPVARNRNELLDDQYGRMVAAMARDRGRGLTDAKVRALVDQALFVPAAAVAQGLIDAVVAEGDLEEYLATEMGRRLPIRDPDPSPLHPTAWAIGKVAVVLVDGAIVDGKSQDLPFTDSVVGSETIVAALEEARRSPSVRAVVLRVNSPGGSAQASDVMARAIVKLRKAGKPVVVSMGDIAASGGYYISAPADAIFAQPSTITGSIGIFTYKVDVRSLLQKVGVAVETYTRGAHADFMSLYRPWSEDEKKLAAERIRHLYGLFLQTIADGRKAQGLTAARADELGRGRIWTGSQALGHRLVDHAGGLGAAIDHAARLGRVELGTGALPDLTVLPPPSINPLAALIAPSFEVDSPSNLPQRTGGGVFETMRSPALRALGRLLAPILLGAGEGTEARMPYEIAYR